MSNVRINQQSPFAPAICLHGGKVHMVFVANNDSRELLHAVTEFGGPIGSEWKRLNNLGQSSKHAPALQVFAGKLTVVFVANNDTNSLLRCTYDDSADAWSQNVFLGESSKSAPRLEPDGFLYFVANNETNDLLVTFI